jgi:acetoacetyl-CoA synthetase
MWTRPTPPGCRAIISRNEKGNHRELSWPELRRQVASMALHLRAQGLQPGDRVAAYLPNVPEAMVAFLAVVSLGGVWSICAPDMGTAAVLDRFKQIEPKVLIACDGVRYGGRDFDRGGCGGRVARRAAQRAACGDPPQPGAGRCGAGSAAAPAR